MCARIRLCNFEPHNLTLYVYTGSFDKNGNMYWVRIGEYGQYLEDYHIKVPELKIRKDWYNMIDAKEMDKIVLNSMFDHYNRYDSSEADKYSLQKESKAKTDSLLTITTMPKKGGLSGTSAGTTTASKVDGPKLDDSIADEPHRKLTTTNTTVSIGAEGDSISTVTYTNNIFVVNTFAPTATFTEVGNIVDTAPLAASTSLPTSTTTVLSPVVDTTETVTSQGQKEPLQPVFDSSLAPVALPTTATSASEETKAVGEPVELIYDRSGKLVPKDSLTNTTDTTTTDALVDDDASYSGHLDDYTATNRRVNRYGRGGSADDGFRYYGRPEPLYNESDFVYVDAHILGSPVLVDVNDDGYASVFVAVSYYFDKDQYAGKALDADPDMYVSHILL